MKAMGSSWHARELRKSGREPVLMIALEMVGYFSTDPGSQAYPIGLLSRIDHLRRDEGDLKV